jgi:pimeloyl-ACP methyl ester carboxylesterase
LTTADGALLHLHAETAGPPDGRLVILLHGFPEYWYGWRSQIGPLARSGFFVVAPDQRGYNLSDKPHGVAQYQIDALAGDILGIIDHYGREQAIIVGHDWGAAVAWHLAIHHPQRVERLAILNVPHPAAMTRALRSPATGQLGRSWYIGFFQIPGLPEFLLRAGRFAALRGMLRGSSRPDTFSKEDLRRYTDAWKQPGALTAMLNWYRAALRTGGGIRGEGRVSMPTLILWGEKDIALSSENARWSLEYCDQGRLVLFPEATHWVQHDESERVTARLLDFFEER